MQTHHIPSRCKFCNIEVSRKNTRCLKCAKKEYNNNNHGNRYKGELPKCLFCNKKLSKRKYSICLLCNNKKFKIDRLGSNNPNWKGGLTDLKIVIRRSDAYAIWRTKIFERDNYRCLQCNAKGYLQVDHIKRFIDIVKDFLAKYSQLSQIEDRETLVRLAITYEPFWDLSNGRTLYKECHRKTPTYGNKSAISMNHADSTFT